MAMIKCENQKRICHVRQSITKPEKPVKESLDTPFKYTEEIEKQSESGDETDLENDMNNYKRLINKVSNKIDLWHQNLTDMKQG